MISMNADSLRQCIDSVRKVGLEAKAQELKIYRAEVLKLFRFLLEVTPQYSGQMVYNWDIQVGDAPSGGFQPLAGIEASKQAHVATREAGDMTGPAASAYMRGVRRIADITHFGQPVYFVNHDLLEIDSPMVIGVDDGSVQELRDSVVIFAWVSITSYLRSRNGSANQLYGDLS